MHAPSPTEQLFRVVVAVFSLSALFATPWPGDRELFSPHHPCLTGVYPINHPRCR